MPALKTPPNLGTYFPPKVMLDGQWRYMVGITEWHDHEHDAKLAHHYREALQNLRANFCAMTPTPIIESWIAMVDLALERH